MRRYHHNYPREQIGEELRGWFDLVVIHGFLFVYPSAIAAGLCAWNFAHQPRIGLFVQGVISFLFFIFFGAHGLRDIGEIKRTHVRACYSERVGDTKTFLAGEAISRNMRLLDDLADRLGVRAIYDFGLVRYALTHGMVWHEADELLRSVSPILDHLKGHPEELAESAAILEDLEKWEVSFKLAREKGIRVCLHFTNSHVYSGAMERQLLPCSHF